MAIDDSTPPHAPESADVSGSTDELRTLLGAYSGALEAINGDLAILWARPEQRLLHWVRLPVPRTLVRILLVLHVNRCVSALKRRTACHVALADDAPKSQRDLKMLEQFEQSLPPGLRLAVVWPLALIATLLIAYVLANYVMWLPTGRLLGDLTAAAVDLNRQAAIEAFRKTPPKLDPYLGAAAIIAWSVTLVIAPLLPAFSVKRRLLTDLAGPEEHGFAAIDAQRVYDPELDIVAALTLVTPVAVFGIVGVEAAVEGDSSSWWMATPHVALAVFACVELRARYGRRRSEATRWSGGLTRLSLLLTCAMSVAWFIFGITRSQERAPSAVVQVGEKIGGRELAFTVTAIQQNATCADPFRPLKPGQQFLRFDLDVTSLAVDRFSDSDAANSLRLRHWSVEGNDGVVEKDIYVYTKCGDGTEDISQPVVPGTHTKPVVVINAPKPAAFLRLDIPHHGLLRWPIPSAASS